MTNPLVRLGQLGQSPWYDFITRELIASGKLARLISADGLRGMTSNPTIFEKAIAGSADYDDDIREAAARGKNSAEIFEILAVADVRAACGAFHTVYRATDGVDGLVSLEVSPELANDTAGTVAEAKRLWAAVGKPNAMIKIPATPAGLPAITDTLAAGISVNVTLLFSVERYQQVIEAFLAGLERRTARGLPVDRIRSVASFFVSRVDGRIDPMLDRIGDPKGLRGTIAIANAADAYDKFLRSLETDRWAALASEGALPQRPLWASTSTKDPKYPDTYYVEALIGPDTVNTLPPDTFEAYRDHGTPEPRIAAAMATACERLEALASVGIDLAEVTRFLEEDGVKKFAASYRDLLAGIDAKSTLLTSTR
ncbi:MAG: transaldolase [Gemmatimonadales bacterium]|nr:transaldolase [Gemmatimonadales bacterium]